MARFSVKRKAEAAPINVRAPTKPNPSIYEVRSRSDSMDEYEEHEGTFMDQQSPVVTRVKKTPALRNPEAVKFVTAKEHEGGTGRTESQQFIDMVKLGTKKKGAMKKQKAYHEQFEQVVIAEEDGLRKQIREQEAKVTIRDVDFSNGFSLAYSSLFSDDSAVIQVSKSNLLDKSKNLLYQQGAVLIKESRKLMDGFEHSNSMLLSQRNSSPAEKTWEEDIGQINYILEKGREVGERKIVRIVGAAHDFHIDADAGTISDMLYTEIEAVSDNIWANTARRQERAVKITTRTLPWE